MQKFSEFVNDYKKYREENGMTSEITPEQVKQIRELYESLNSKKSSKLKESEEVDLNSNGEAKPEVEPAEPTIEEPKDAKLTESEEKEEPKAEEKEACACGKPDCDGKDCDDKEKVEESKTMDFDTALEEYREWKMVNKGTRGVTLKEKEALKAKLEGKQPLKESFEKCEACGEESPKTFTVAEFLDSDAMKEFDEADVKDLTVEDVVKAVNETGYVDDVTESTKLCPDCILKAIDKLIDKKLDNEEPKEGDFEGMEDVQFEESIEGFKKVVTQYREWKKANYNTAKLTEAEKETLKAKFLEKVSKLNESKEEAEKPAENARLTEALAQYKEWKKANHGTDEITKFEEATVARNLVLDDITAKLEEAKKLVESGKKHLTEGDVMDAGADAQAAAGAVNDATAMGADPAMAGDPNAAVDPNAGAALPQNIVDEISNIKTSIDALATECGIESPVDLGADAGAGVPAVTGAADPNVDATAGAVDPNAAPADPNAGAAPLPESIKSVKARIAARNAALKETCKFSNTKMADNKDTVKLPSEAELVKGTKSGIAKAAEWPVKDVKPSDPKKLKNIEECTQEDLAKMTLDESGEFDWKLYTKLLKNL